MCPSQAQAADRQTIQRWYNSKRWRDRRADQLRRKPLCAMCEQQKRVTPATIADHVKPHKGDERAFWLGALQSLCKACHDGPKKAFEVSGKMRGCDENGIPFAFGAQVIDKAMGGSKSSELFGQKASAH